MSVILTKVRLPQRRKDVLRRARLLDALHRGLDRKLTFVSAPAGYGKTTLLVDFAADLDATVCWYSISSDHADLVSFAEHLVAAFQQHFPEFGQDLVKSFNAPGTSLESYSLAIDIANELLTQVTDFCVLMLDDFHLVGEVQIITDFIEALLEHLPDQIRLVIAGRSFFGIPSANLYVHGDLATIGERELRFRAEELQNLIRQNYRLKLPPDQAAQLAKVSDGWIVAVLLAARAIERGEFPKLEGAKEQLYGFLAEEVLSQQPPALQSLLLATAIVDEFDEPLCNYLLETESSEELLVELSGRNLFVTQTESGGAISYQYHHLFSEFLRDQLWKTDPPKARMLHQRAADWFFQRQTWELAVRHRLAAGDREGAACWMDQVASSLFISGHAQLLSKWVETLSDPPDSRARAPRLLLSQAKMLIDQGVFDETTEHLLAQAEAALRSVGDIEQIASVLYTRGMLRRYQGKFAEAQELAQNVQSLLEKETGLRWHQAERLKAICYAHLNQSGQAILHLTTAVSGFRESEHASDLAEALNDLGLIHFRRGNVMEAQACWLEVLEIRRKLGNRGLLALALNNVGFLFHQIGHYQRAWQAYDEALQTAQSAKAGRVAAAVFNGQGDLLRDLEEWQLAQTAYEAAREIYILMNDQDGLAYTYAGFRELEQVRGNFNDALYWLREVARCRKDDLESPDYQAGLGEIYFYMGQADLAAKSLSQALSTWNGLPKPEQSQILTEFLLAGALFELGKNRQALKTLDRTLQHIAQLGYDQFLVVAGRHTGQLLSQAIEVWPNHSQLHSLIRRINQFQTGLTSLQSKASIVEPPRPMQIELFAFGIGRVRRDGEFIPAPTWVSSRSRALFFYLVDRGQASKDEIALDFWPDFSLEKVTSNFHSTLWRVRKAVGREVLVFENDLYRLAPSVAAWHDVAEFEAQIKRASNGTLSLAERIEACRQALALYQGSYLPDISLEWAERRRRDLQGQYMLGLIQLAGWELERSHYEAAKPLYEEIIGLDPYLDEARAGIMKCLFYAGSPAAARSHFIAYKKLLKDELGSDPPPLLQSLYEQMFQ